MLSIWKFSVWRNRWKRQERQSHDHRVIQVGRDLRRSLVLPPAQNRSRSEFRPGSSVLFPVGSWKPPETETVQLLWAACSTLQLLSSYPVSPYIQFVSMCWLLPLILPPHTTVKTVVPVSPFFQHAWVRLEGALPFSILTDPSSLVSPASLMKVYLVTSSTPLITPLKRTGPNTLVTGLQAEYNPLTSTPRAQWSSAAEYCPILAYSDLGGSHVLKTRWLP